MERFNDKVAVVTGASSGIGEAIVVALVSRGLKVVGLARRKERLEELSTRLQIKDGKFYPLQCDITVETDIVNAFKWIKANAGPVHILVNNAGIMCSKGLVDGNYQDWKALLDTNVLGLCISTQLAVKDMQENDINGHIIHIGSIAGHSVPNYPEANLYPASKWAVKALTETLRQELISLGSKIKISSISPGMVKTDMIIQEAPIVENPRYQYFNFSPLLNPEDVADSLIYILSTPPHVQVHELIIKPIGEIP